MLELHFIVVKMSKCAVEMPLNRPRLVSGSQITKKSVSMLRHGHRQRAGQKGNMVAVMLRAQFIAHNIQSC